MISFNELRIDNVEDKLIIEYAVSEADIYENYFIDKIYVEWYKNVTDMYDKSTKTIVVYDSEGTATLKSRYELLASEVLSKLTVGTDTFNNGVFYVRFVCINTTDADADDIEVLGVAVDWHLMYEKGMKQIAKFSNECRFSCDSHAGLEQFILIWFGIKLALETEDALQLTKLWDKFLRISNSGMLEMDCNCR